MESNTYILLSYYNYCVLKANHVIIHFRIPSKICKRLDCIIDASGFGTENVKGRLPETDSNPFNHTLVHGLLSKLIGENKSNFSLR